MAGDDEDDNGDDEDDNGDNDDDNRMMMITTGMMIITMMNMTQWWHKKYHNDDYDKKSWEATYNLLPRTPAKPWVDNNDENHKTIFKLGRKSYSTKVSPSFDQSIISQNLSREPIAFCMVRGIYAHIHSLFFKEEKKVTTAIQK